LTTEQIDIRAAGIKDVPLVLDLWEQARSGHASTPDLPEDLERLVLESPGTLLIATGAGRIVGVLIAAWDGWRGNLYRLAVDRERRRSGIGLALVRAGEAHLRQRGAKRITALVAYDDPVAGAFWDSAGYPQDPQIGRRVCNV
jgi:ribosomal protein S18 acetylase RimI-like enzyme